MPNEEDYPLEVYEDDDDEAPWFTDDDTEDGGENFFDYSTACRIPKGPCCVASFANT